MADTYSAQVVSTITPQASYYAMNPGYVHVPLLAFTLLHESSTVWEVHYPMDEVCAKDIGTCMYIVHVYVCDHATKQNLRCMYFTSSSNGPLKLGLSYVTRNMYVWSQWCSAYVQFMYVVSLQYITLLIDQISASQPTVKHIMYCSMCAGKQCHWSGEYWKVTSSFYFHLSVTYMYVHTCMYIHD